MMQKTNQGVYISSLLSAVKGVKHGFTSKKQGSVISKKGQAEVFSKLHVGSDSVIWMQQVHGASVVEVTAQDAGKTIEGVDGLLYKSTAKERGSPILTVHVGDCVPILLVDPKVNLIGAVHAGWKGTIGHIMKTAIAHCVRLGSNPDDILIAMGPYIHSCCYSVQGDRAQLFEDAYGKKSGVVKKVGDTHVLDIGLANEIDLIEQGVCSTHIDRSSDCTLCTPEEWYSFRRKTELFGEMIGYITWEEHGV